MRSSIGKDMQGAGYAGLSLILQALRGATCEASRNMSANGRDAQEKIASVVPTCRGAHSLFSSMFRIGTSNGRDDRTAGRLRSFGKRLAVRTAALALCMAGVMFRNTMASALLAHSLSSAVFRVAEARAVMAGLQRGAHS